MAYNAEPVVTVVRGETIEAIHNASIAVINQEGRLTHYLGNPDDVFMTRSSIKPFQLLPLILTGAAKKYGFTLEQLAIMCGSHTGSDKHREVVLKNLKLAGNSPEDLGCGCHWPIGMEMEKEYPYKEEDKDPTRHNCSGKHSGFLALARFLGDKPEDYLNPDSKTQQLIKKTLAEYAEYDEKSMPFAIDGCSAPNYPLPIQKLALAFKKLANGEGDSPEVSDAVNTIKKAMTQYPYMVSGDNRLDYDLMRSFPGNLVCKIGAESIEGIGMSEPSLGICVKIYDGNFRALGPVCVEVLKQLGIIQNLDDYPYLKGHEEPEVRNARDIVTGKIISGFKLKKVT